MQNAKYVKIPIDPYKIKQKVFMGLTKRQVISFGIGGACGILPFFIVKAFAGVMPGIIVLCICAFPAIFCGLYDKNGIHLEQYARLVFKHFTTPRRIIFKSHNVAEIAELESEKQELKRKLRNG
jgi:hypothetical protein